jgi:hypothetical protein
MGVTHPDAVSLGSGRFERTRNGIALAAPIPSSRMREVKRRPSVSMAASMSLRTSSAGMRTHLRGRVENLKLNPRRDVLQPIFEAVSNSLQSIAATGRRDGLIRVELLRSTAQGELILSKIDRDNPDRSLPEISSVRIIDNGHGFTEEAYDSFLTLDSRARWNSEGRALAGLFG